MRAQRQIAYVATGLTIRLDEDGPLVRLGCEYEGALGENPRQHVEANLLMLRKVIQLAVEDVLMEVRLPDGRLAQ